VPAIIVEDDAPPIVKILAVTLRRAAAQPKLARQLDRMRGSVALKSTSDPQAVTIRFAKGDVSLSHGVAPDADVVIALDFNTMGQPGASGPKVTGAARHPLLAFGVSKVLEPPVIGGWAGAAESFWEWSAGRKGRPGYLRVVCTDDGGERTFGDAAGGTTIEIHGPAWALVNVFTGGDHLGAAVLEHRVQAVADFPVLSEVVGLATSLMLGDE
jgi:hypothetical protein